MVLADFARVGGYAIVPKALDKSSVGPKGNPVVLFVLSNGSCTPCPTFVYVSLCANVLTLHFHNLLSRSAPCPLQNMLTDQHCLQKTQFDDMIEEVSIRSESHLRDIQKLKEETRQLTNAHVAVVI